MNKKIKIILTIVFLSLIFAMPTYASSNVVTNGTSATSLRNPSGTSARSSDLRQPSTTTGSSDSILRSDRTNSSNTSAQTSLTESDKTEVVNEPGKSENKTVASTSELPKAGLSPVIYVAISGIVLLATFLYKKVVKYNI